MSLIRAKNPIPTLHQELFMSLKQLCRLFLFLHAHTHTHTCTNKHTNTQQQIHPVFHPLLPASRVFWPRSQDCFPERLLLWSLTQEVKGGEAGTDFYFRHGSHWFHVFFFFFSPVCFWLSAQNMFALTDFSTLLSIKRVVWFLFLAITFSVL